jgi:hypothetical protein
MMTGLFEGRIDTTTTLQKQCQVSITLTYHDFRFTIKIISRAVNVTFSQIKQKIPEC